MTVSSILVNETDDAVLRLVSLLAETAPSQLLRETFQADCERHIQDRNVAELLSTILQDKGAMYALFALDSASEAVAVVSLLGALLQSVPSEQETILAQAMKQNIIQAPTATTKTASGKEIPAVAAVERKITLLSALYNIRSSWMEKCNLLQPMIDLASSYPMRFLAPDTTLGQLLVETSATSQQASSTTTCPRLVSLLDGWQVEVVDRRSLYQTICAALLPQDVRKQRFLLLLTDSYHGCSVEAVDATGLQAAKEAAIGAIRDPVALFTHQRSLLDQPAIKALREKEPILYGLLEVFQEGKLDDYEEFLAEKGGPAAVLEPFQLNGDACERHMRILSMCSLATEHEEIPYSVVAKTLKLSDDQVESWVIAAVSSGLLQAKMDQLTHKVMVERCVVRKFDMDQWKILQQRLAAWKNNVGNVLAGLKQQQQAVGATTGPSATTGSIPTAP